jgi:hypothetical protein
LLTLSVLASGVAAQHTFVRDPMILVDQECTAKIKEYTTQPFVSSRLVG